MFDRYYRELLNFLARKVRDRETAADLTQESFARVYAAEQSGTAIRDPRALLYKTARNLVIDTFRHGDVRGESVNVAPGETVVDPDEHAGPDVYEPEVALESRQRFEAIAAIVETLPPRCREAFMLVKFEGLAHAEAAERMGVAVKTIEMQVQIALEACWDRLDALDGVSESHTARPRKRRLKK